MQRWFKSALKKCLLGKIKEIVANYYKGKQVHQPVNAQPAKRQKRSQRDSFSFCNRSKVTEDTGEELTIHDPKDMAEEEVEEYMKMYENKNGLYHLFNKASEPLIGWCLSDVVKKYPGTSRAAKGVYSMLAGSGGLENDIGGFGHIISRKRGSMDLGLVSCQMLVKHNMKFLNKPGGSKKIPTFGQDWQKYIPKMEWVLEAGSWVVQSKSSSLTEEEFFADPEEMMTQADSDGMDSEGEETQVY